jgi:hypothetical protein
MSGAPTTGVNLRQDEWLILMKVFVEKLEENEKRRDADSRTKSNLFIGVAVPILLLGVCAFLSVPCLQPPHKS